MHSMLYANFYRHARNSWGARLIVCVDVLSRGLHPPSRRIRLNLCIMSATSNPAGDQLHNYKQNHKEASVLTTSAGAPIGCKTVVRTAGARGPMLLQDIVFLDELGHFDRERIPERVVHAKGAGAHGSFEATHDISKYTKASVFEEGKKTPVFVRFSTVGGESGSADTARDPRGFAIKFYTEEGNWDLVGNNTPIFFIREPILFPNFIHTQKRNPVTHLKDANMFWDFISLRPETTHQVMFLFSDRGTPYGYRHMNGYGSHTFKLVNKQGEAVYCKFHLKTNQGIRNLTTEEAGQMAGRDPDFAIRDLYNAIGGGDYPSWTMFIQVMTMEQADKHSFNPFDLTKVWCHGEYPLHEVGKMTLNRNPKNYFAEVEQSAFSPANMTPGIEPSPDKMLQGRLFSYTDTHLHRLGANYKQLPINCPYRTLVANTQRDGPMALQNQDDAPNYHPNSFHGAAELQRANESPFECSGTADRHDSANEDNFSQATDFWNKVLDNGGRERLVSNMASHLRDAAPLLQERAINNFTKVHPDFGKRLGEAVKTTVIGRGIL